MNEYNKLKTYKSNFQVVRSDEITQIQADALVMDYDYDYLKKLLFNICNDRKNIIKNIMLTTKTLASGYMSLPCSTRLYPELNSNCFTTPSLIDNYKYFVFSFISHDANVNTTSNLWLSIYRKHISYAINGMLNHLCNNLKCSSVVFVSSGVIDNETSRLRMWVINNIFVDLLKRKYRDLKCIWVLPENNECFNQAPLLNIVKKEIDKKRIFKYGQLQKEEKNKLNLQEVLDEISQYITSKITNYHKKLDLIMQNRTSYDILSDYITGFNGTSTELADMIGCNKGQISKYMSKQHKIRLKERALALALALHLNNEDIFIFLNGTGFEFPVDERDNLLIHYVHQNPDYTFKEAISLIDSMFPNKPAIVPDRYGIEEKETKRATSKEDTQ